MKKSIFPLCFLAMIGVGILSMNSFSGKTSFSNVFADGKNSVSEYSVKYSDCISEMNFSDFDDYDLDKPFPKKPDMIKEINRFLKEYEVSLDATVKNLNAIDAHEFLHNEFERCENKIRKNLRSEIQLYYNFHVMKMCYEKDKYLNLDSNKNLLKHK